jgi:hypothetical protein
MLSSAANDQDLYAQLKELQRQGEFIDIQEECVYVSVFVCVCVCS